MVAITLMPMNFNNCSCYHIDIDQSQNLDNNVDLNEE